MLCINDTTPKNVYAPARPFWGPGNRNPGTFGSFGFKRTSAFCSKKDIILIATDEMGKAHSFIKRNRKKLVNGQIYSDILALLVRYICLSNAIYSHYVRMRYDKNLVSARKHIAPNRYIAYKIHIANLERDLYHGETSFALTPLEVLKLQTYTFPKIRQYPIPAELLLQYCKGTYVFRQ